MSSRRGTGYLYQPKYTDKRTGERKTSSVWWCEYRQNGKRIRESTGCRQQSSARKFLQQRLANNTGPLLRDLERVRFEDLAAAIRNDYAVNERKSTARLEHSLRHLAAAFSGWRAVDIGESAIEDYKARRKATDASNATINRELSALRRMFRIGQRTKLVDRVPVIELLTERNTRTGFVDSAEFEAVVAQLPEHLKPIAIVAFITGWRKSELLSRRWCHVDSGWLRLEPGETKNNEGRQFPIGSHPRLRAVIDTQRQRKLALERATGQIVSPLFFNAAGNAIKDFRAAWRSACARAGNPGLLFHDLRRSAVRNLEHAAVPRSVAMALTGHRTESVYRRYAICSEADLREGVAKLSAAR
jgi:integrase